MPDIPKSRHEKAAMKRIMVLPSIWSALVSTTRIDPQASPSAEGFFHAMEKCFSFR
jgi:hypothetical protein